MGTDYRFRKNHCFYLSFLPKSRTNYSFQWKTNFNKKKLLLLGEQIFRLIEISFIMRGKRFCVLQKKAVKSKTLFQLIQIKFLASEKHSFQYFQISYNENIFLNRSFIPASGNLISVQWKQYGFAQSLKTIIEVRGNQF